LEKAENEIKQEQERASQSPESAKDVVSPYKQQQEEDIIESSRYKSEDFNRYFQSLLKNNLDEIDTSSGDRKSDDELQHH